LEFINEIYILILTPSVQTGHCQLENFRGESTLASWLKATSLFYCYGKYERKLRFNIVEFPIESSNSDNNDSANDSANDRLLEKADSTTMDFSNIDRMDVETILNLMPCKRYSQLIRLRYMENMTNEETATAMAMTLDNYYNRHKLAKAQYERCARKEGLL
jgi:DNA-directed RNA polymerase specialized sigma24 family protein